MLAAVLVWSKVAACALVGPERLVGPRPAFAVGTLTALTKIEKQQRPGTGFGVLVLFLRAALNGSHYHKECVKVRAGGPVTSDLTRVNI